MATLVNIILKRIKQEIDVARFTATGLDEPTAITNFSQLAIVMRHVKTAEVLNGDF